MNTTLLIRSLVFLFCLQIIVVYPVLSQSNTSIDRSELLQRFDSILPVIQTKLFNTYQEVSSDADTYPSHTDYETGEWMTTNKYGWTSGFYTGQLWVMYQLTGHSDWAERAHNSTESLLAIQDFSGDHDNGFRVLPSYGLGLELTGNLAYSRVLDRAARSLASRFRPNIGVIKSWDWTPGYVTWNNPVIIDNMMNLELLYSVSLRTGNTTLFDMATQHALHTLENHFREDGSTYHIVDYSDQGTVLWKGTVQGHSRESAWSRGQSWAIYGFIVAYRYTRDSRFLNASIHAASYFLDHLPDDNVPYYDFRDPAIPRVSKDVSAAAIAASALLELYTETSMPIYLDSAEQILNSIIRPPYFDETYTTASILEKGTRHRGDREIGLVYGDYYFLEAWTRYLSLDENSLPELDTQHFNYLGQNYPNPFQQTTTIPYTIEEPGNVQILLFDQTGRLVQTLFNGYRVPGNYYEVLSSSGLSQGIYFYQLIVESKAQSKKLLIFN